MPEMLTQRTAEKLRPVSKRIERPAGLVPGLYLVVQPSGAKAWCVRYRDAGGKPVKLTLGRFPVLSLKDARERARTALIDVDRGKDPHKEKIAARAAGKRAKAEGAPVDQDLFENVLDQFIERMEKTARPRTAREYRRLLTKDVIPQWKGKRIHQVSKRDVLDLLDVMERRGAGIAANRTFQALRKLMNWAVQRGMVEISPCMGLRAPVQEQSRDRVLTDSELKVLWLGLEQVPYPLRHFTKFLLLTGARRDETAGMTWAEIDKEARTWLLPAARSKNSTEKLVPLSDVAMDVINSIIAIHSEKGYVFTVTGRCPFNTFHAAKRKLDQVTGFSDWTLHDLRRTCATTMHRLGFAPHVCEAVLGHRIATGVAAVYNRYQYGSEKRIALEAWARFLIDNAEDKSSRSPNTLQKNCAAVFDTIANAS